MKIHNMQEKRLLKAILLMSIIAGAAQATTYEYAAPLTSPPGMYFGTGNQNADMAIADTGVVELGLSAIIRFQGPVDPGAGSSTYIVPTGILSGGLPRWGFIFSVNTQYNGGTAVLGDFTYTLNITDISNSNSGPTGDPIRLIGDNSGFGSGGKTAGVTLNSQWGAQNSENLGFAGFLPGFNPLAYDDYEITFSAYDSGGSLIGTDTIEIDAEAPEPVTVLLTGLGLAGFGLASRQWRRLSSR